VQRHALGIVFVTLLLVGCRGSEPPGASTGPARSERAAYVEQQTDKLRGDGRFRRVRGAEEGPTPTDEQQAVIERLEAIGYAQGSQPVPPLSGVTLHDAGRAGSGYNLVNAGHSSEAVLLDMDGAEVHRWSDEFWTIFPEYPARKNHKGTQYWRRVHLLPDGGLLAMHGGLALVKLGVDSTVVWSSPVRYHHDLHVTGDGSIYVLAREAHVVPRVHPEEPIVEDFVVVLDAHGVEQRRVSLLECFENAEPQIRDIWTTSEQQIGDIFHTNSIELLDGQAADAVPEFLAGRVLISIYELDAVAVVDLDLVQVVWAHTRGSKRQHDAEIIGPARLLLFDNRDARGRSAVEEYTLPKMRRAWHYDGSADDPFYSHTCGTSQRLANGNTLITESDNGRAFEVTSGGDKVWEFHTPERAGPDGEYIATLFEVQRIDPAAVEAWVWKGDRKGDVRN
jgi:hypothetical protein